MLKDNIFNTKQQKIFKSLQHTQGSREDEPSAIEQCYLVAEKLPRLETWRV